MLTIWVRLRLMMAILCALLALHVVVLIDTRLNWQLTLLATEYGHRIAVLAIVLACTGMFIRRRDELAGTALLLGSAFVLLTPVWQMAGISGRLAGEMRAAFGEKAARHPHSVPFTSLWLGLKKPAWKGAEEFVYTDSTATQPLRVHFFRAEHRAHAPCIIVIHGGGWENGAATEFPAWSAYWSARGYAVACVEYRLAPTHQWPAPLADMQQAIAWLKAHSDELNIDPARFVLLGRSAGGQIASACAVSLRDPMIRGCIAIYAPHDMFFARRFAFAEDVLDSRRLLRNYLGGDPDEAAENYRTASAFMLASSDTCPTLLLHGTRDTFVWNMQSRRYAQRLEQLGVKHHVIEMPWAVHGFDWPFDGPGGQITRAAVDGFLNAVVGD
ncbi:acetyl esterase/lipase [Roseimicrobium gellanilyticum]|uniref:Acetyl esterase/lipase n=1 Tax=Roseimicrobium gellanilyticum TaxID=748857 RepID=A0A366HT34_9BACT|nr:alpha/beta hydrolase [Roseimicrobium gellanilyticum]RBP47433.1 acetyl esterase/lipase [Roseimicrobium gellanilyticum]